MMDRGKKRKRALSMHGILLLMMCGLTLFSFLLLILVATLSGLRPSLDELAYRTLYSHAMDSGSSFSSELNVLSRAARQSADDLGKLLSDEMTESDFSFDEISGDTERIDALLSVSAAALTSYLEGNSSSGAFVILNTQYTDELHRAALYLRDPSPRAGSGTAQDLTVLRGHTRILDVSLALDKNWQYEQLLGDEENDYFLLPQNAVSQYPRADRRDWGYWSRPLRLSTGDIDIITYTTPLITTQGKVIGVFGVECSLRYLQQIMPSENLPFDDGFYLIGMLEEGVLLPDTAFSASSLGAKFLFDHTQSVALEPLSGMQSYDIFQISDAELFAAHTSLGLYGTNSPFAGESYSLIALAPRDSVMESSDNITLSILIAVATSLLFGILGAQLLSKLFSKRIENLASQVSGVQPEEPLSLEPTSIKEIDELADVIQTMNRDIRMYAARMSTIVDIVGIPMGAFEMNLQTGDLHITDSLGKMLGISPSGASSDVFFALLPGLAVPEGDNAHAESEICVDSSGSETERWMRVHMLKQDGHLYGTIIDISEEIRQKKWLEFERDYDPLTHLLNRNAYPSRMNALIEANPDAAGVMVFGDLDNLKSINDTFGHDMGDRYIRLAAAALRRFEEYGGVVARISGDEFVAFIHNLQSREKLDEMLRDVLRSVRETSMLLPDGTTQKVRISAGLAFYPDDARTIDDLIRYADFAMYEIKHSVKGGTKEFDKASYEKNSYILNKPNQLDLLIEGRRVRFAFQPIIDVRTGRPFGYEALMRPQMREFHTPLEVVMLARARSKLYQIEKLTLSCFFEFIGKNEHLLEEYSFFVNLIANQILSAEDLEQLAQEAPRQRGKVVMEITESENGGEEIIGEKLASIRENGYLVALDDYGTGYNSEVSLLRTSPDFLKVDMSIIRNINNDPNRQRMMRTIAEYARENDIRVVAEGVETAGEMETSIALGADFIQGYFTGKPNFDPGTFEEGPCRMAREMYRKHHG